jgi:hypothetical protein
MNLRGPASWIIACGYFCEVSAVQNEETMNMKIDSVQHKNLPHQLAPYCETCSTVTVFGLISSTVTSAGARLSKTICLAPLE